MISCMSRSLMLLSLLILLTGPSWIVLWEGLVSGYEGVSMFGTFGAVFGSSCLLVAVALGLGLVAFGD